MPVTDDPASQAGEDAGGGVPGDDPPPDAESAGPAPPFGAPAGLAHPVGAPSARIIPLPPPDEPISEVPGRTPPASVPPPTLLVSIPPKGRPTPPHGVEAPIREVPAAVVRPPRALWGPPEAPHEGDAFPEHSVEVSAVAGSPAAGPPVAAVDAVPGSGDADVTVVVRRRRAAWQLLRAAGAPIDLVADVVILGRLPEPNPAFPAAQLVSLDDASRTVSKTHARLERQGDGWQLVDLHSTNGVVVTGSDGDDAEIDPDAAVAIHERFVLGEVELRLVRSGAAPDGAGFDRPGSRA